MKTLLLLGMIYGLSLNSMASDLVQCKIKMRKTVRHNWATDVYNDIPEGQCSKLASYRTINPRDCKSRAQEAGFDCIVFGEWVVVGTDYFNNGITSRGQNCFGCVQ